MHPSVDKQTVPLEVGSDGVMRVGGTRVTLDSVVEAFEEGCTCEEIAQQYPSLRLPDIYVVVGYYLNHRDELKAYFDQRQSERQAVHRDRPLSPADSNQAIRARLLHRRSSIGS